MKVIIVSFLLLMMYQGCRRGTPPDSDALIHYIDKNGNDLFTTGQNGYYKDSVAILNIDGKKIPNYAGFAEWAPSTLILGVSAYTTITNNYCTLLVHLKPGVDDTIKFHLIGNTDRFDTIWYNGRLKKAGTKVIDSVTNPDIYTTMFTVVH